MAFSMLALITQAAIISQLHYETFWRKNLPEGFAEARIQSRLQAETDRLMHPSVTTEEFAEAMFGDVLVVRGDKATLFFVTACGMN